MNFIITDESLMAEDLLKNESIFHVANGYIGVRGNFEEGYDEDYETIRGTYINAFHETSKIEYGEKLHGFPEIKQNIVNIIDAQGIVLIIDDERFSLFDGEVLSYKRCFDLKNGYTKREITWKSNKGHMLKIKVIRMASFHNLELFLISYEIESLNYNGAIKLVSTLNGDVSNYSNSNDPRVSSDAVKPLKIKNKFIRNNLATMTVQAQNSLLQASCSVFHKTTKETKATIKDAGKSIEFQFDFDIVANEKIRLEKFCVFSDSLRHYYPEEVSRHLCVKICSQDAEFYFVKQKAYLREFWDNSGVRITGNSLLQQGINYNIYQLLQSVGKDKHSNISAKGLSGEGYEGHYFWDTEIYMLPFFTLTEPELAKNLLMYRYSTLDFARQNARMLGHKKGALFPWRTIRGSECSAFFPAGTAQYHIVGDIAYSFIKYFLVTGDVDFIRNYGIEVIIETARLWMDTGNFRNGTFRINDVTGPDEYTCIVNNNYYTNLIAQYNLKWAANFCNMLKKDYYEDYIRLQEKLDFVDAEMEAFEVAANQMYLPYDEQLDINPQDDSFLDKEIWNFHDTPKENYPLLMNYHPLILYRYQVCKQADTVLAHFLLENRENQRLSTIKNSFDYYEKITTHDSSLSSCIFSIMASRVGYLEKAYDYFLESVRLDLDDTHGNTKDGIHTANMGGTYLAIVYGFAGLRIHEDGLSLRPQIPSAWESYDFKVCYRSSRIAITVNKNEVCLTLEKGDHIDIKLMRGDSALEFETISLFVGSSKQISLN